MYLQNSGLGNIINPLLSLADAEVILCPCYSSSVGEANREFMMSRNIRSKDV